MSARPLHQTASSLARRALCPGSARMERGLLDQPTPESTRGDRVHAALAVRAADGGPSVSSEAWMSASEEEQTCIGILARREETAIGPYLEKHGPDFTVHREKRFYITKGGRAVFSAQLDVVYVWPAVTVIFDYKSGWGDVPDSAENHQLMGQVAALTASFDEGTEPPLIEAAILQPKAESDPVGYNAAQCKAAIIEVLRVLGETEAADAPLHPGEQQCQYCKAAHLCPALQGLTEALAITPASGAASLPLQSAQTLGDLLEASAAADIYIAAVRKEARRRLTAGEPVPGWELEPGATRRAVTDAQKALEALTPLGVTIEEVLACVKVSVGELETAAKRATGWKGKELTRRFNERLEQAECLQFNQNAPSLKRSEVPH